jgi:hypothetical protein
MELVMMNSPLKNTRLIFYHKQATSARTLFVRFNDSVCAFEPLPASAQLLDHAEKQTLVIHPASLASQAEKRLGLNNGSLETDMEFKEEIATGEGNLIIYLIRFTAIDPPHKFIAPAGGKFISIMDARDLPTTELELLRRAYGVIMGG